MLMRALHAGNLQPGKLVTHRFAMPEILKAYDVFGNAARHDALKVVLTNR
jgi:alcohol dehydrogenase